MKKYNAFIQATDRLCAKESDDSTELSQQLFRMQERIRQSELTVYQKDFLLQHLRSRREDVYA